MLAAIEEVLSTDDTQAWVRRLAPLGVVVAAVESLEQALASEQVAARDMVVEMDTPTGPLRAVGNPIKTGPEVPANRLPPLLGEHSGSRLAAAQP